LKSARLLLKNEEPGGIWQQIKDNKLEKNKGLGNERPKINFQNDEYQHNKFDVNDSEKMKNQ
jgi:hypothetical protein